MEIFEIFMENFILHAPCKVGANFFRDFRIFFLGDSKKVVVDFTEEIS